MSEAMETYLARTEFLDFDAPAIVELIEHTIDESMSPKEKALALFYAVRDGIRYDPYAIRLEADTYRASAVLEAGRGYCVQKAALYAAVCRAVGIPARPGYADVRNHLTTERLSKLIETDLFIFHGYVEVYLDGKWVKATPVFNQELCERFDVLPLDFDGENDSIFHEFDGSGRRHMEYVRERGTYADVPHAQIVAEMMETYPRYFKEHVQEGDFLAEAGS